MGFIDKVKGELLDIIQWLDETGDTLVHRFERYNNEIKHDARLVVREGQVAVFISEGQLADIFHPGTYTLKTANLPLLATLQGWKYGFESPFKAEIYFCSTRQFTNLKWGTPGPCTMRDQEFGAVRVTAYGLYSIKIKDPVKFIREVSGTDGTFSTSSIEDNLRGKIGTRIKEVMPEAGIPVIDLESRVVQLGETLKNRIVPAFEQLGLDLVEVQVQDIGLPEEVEKAIDKAGAMRVIGDMQTYTRYETASAIRDAANNPGGLAAAGVGVGMGFTMGGQLTGAMAGSMTTPPGIPVPPPLPSQLQFYVVLDGQQSGPYDMPALQQMTQSGTLTRESLVWKQGLPSWSAAGQQPDLDLLFVSVPRRFRQSGNGAPKRTEREKVMRITPAIELEYRCKKLQEYMLSDSLDAVIVVQNADLFYFTGTVQSGNLYVPASGQPLFMVRKDAGRARMESGLKEVIPFNSMKDIPAILTQYGYPTPKRIGLELDILPVNFYERYRSIYPDAVFSDATPLIRRVRMIKSHYEIHLMQDAADQVDRVYRRAREIIRVGATDLEIAAELEYTARKDGHQGLIRMRGFNSELFYAQIFSGTDSAVPAYADTPLGGMGLNPSFGQSAGLKRIEPHEPVIIDFAGCVDGYLSDQTRVFSIGKLSDRLRRAYDDMLEIQALMMRTIEVGMSWGALYDVCYTCAVEMGYADSFMGAKGAQVSFIGHGLGVEIDEYPFIARGFNQMPLEIGMAFAFEPKVVFPGEGAIGIENTFYMSNEGLKRLTHSSDELVILD